MADGLADIEEVKKTSRHKMEGALHALDQDFNTVRTGRANPALLDNIKVEAYGQEMPLGQVATVSTPDARTIQISPWDKGQLGVVERAIIAANLGFNPTNDGTCVRINIPQLTEERRKELVKQAAKMAEDARIAVRHVRKHANDHIKKHHKDHDLPEDVLKKAETEVQKMTDEFIKKVDERLKKKEQEIMAV